MKKLNKMTSIGLFIVVLTFILPRFIALPHLILGLGLGVGLTLELIGAYSMNHDISKLRNCKKNMFQKVFRNKVGGVG